MIKYVSEEFRDEKDSIDLFIFGHSHKSMDKIINGKIYFNPGSPTDKAFSEYNSYGIITIENSIIKREIKKIG